MFKSQKQTNKPSPSSISGERVDFRFSNFQALQVPKGWDRLTLSVVSARTGRVIAKLGKGVVRTGSCEWPETLLESVWMPQDDDSSTGTEEYLYKCVVSMGSARSGILGEATINLVSYVCSITPSPISLPLQKCNYGTILQVKIHCLTPDDLDSTSRPGKFSIKERCFSPSVSFEKGFIRGDKLLLKNHLRSEEISENNSSRDSFVFEDHSVSNQPSLNRPDVVSMMENLQHYGKDLTNSGSSKKLLEAAEDTIEELRVEAKMWERNARKLMVDFDILRNEFSNQSKKQADLVMELSAAYAEHDSLKKEIETLKLILLEESAVVKQQEDSTFQTKIHEELENEIKHQRELNNSLALQLERSQESNIDLVSVLQELEETIEQQKVEIENLSSMQLSFAEMDSCHKSDMEDNGNFLIHSSELLKQLEINKLLEARITESEEILKQHEFVIHEKDSALEEALRKLDGYSMKFQENKSSKADLEVQCTNLLKELAQKKSEVDRLEANLLKKEEETNFLMQHQRELETEVADLQKKRNQLEEDLEIMSRENSNSSRCLDDLQNKLKILGEDMDKQIYDNEILQRKSQEIECENQKLKEENLYLESQMKCIATDRDSCHLKLDNSRSIAMKLKAKIVELETEMENKVASLKQNLEDMQTQNSEAQREREHLKEENQKLEESIENLLEEVKILQKSDSELRKACMQVDDQLKKSEKSLCDSYKKVETLEEKLNSMIEDFSFKEEKLNSELDELVRENKMQMEKLAQQEVSMQSYEKLMAENEKTSKLLTSYRTTEEKLKTSINDLELKLTISQCEHQQLLEDTVDLKIQLQKMTELEEEILDLRDQLHKYRNEKGQLEASIQTIFGDSEEIKSENFSLLDKISTLKEAVLEFEKCKREKVSLEEKLVQMENNLTEMKREKKLDEQKIYQLEEEKDKSLKRIVALEADIKLMEEEDKQSCSKNGENGYGGLNDSAVYIGKIKFLESKLAETLEANKKFKIQLQRFRSEERKIQGASSKRAIGENEIMAERERFEETKSSLEGELKDIRERYFVMSLKYAEVEAQRETLVMKLKAAKNGKKRFS